MSVASGPAQGPGQGRREPADAPHHRLAGPVVESDLGEGEIVVVDQQQIRDRLAHQVGYLGALTGDVELDATPPDEAIRESS